MLANGALREKAILARGDPPRGLYVWRAFYGPLSVYAGFLLRRLLDRKPSFELSAAQKPHRTHCPSIGAVLSIKKRRGARTAPPFCRAKEPPSRPFQATHKEPPRRADKELDEQTRVGPQCKRERTR
ncbi:unnamed protein product, partial [Iphiclides podalirius]